MKILTVIAALFVGFAHSAAASEIESQQDAAVACLVGMHDGGENAATWEECRGILFESCIPETIGDAAHLACLGSQKADWETHLDADIAVLQNKLSMDGTRQLGELMAQWLGYLDKKCQSVAKANAATSADAALLGCEISEFAGLATEFENCLSGKSTSPYCQLRD